jgi:hypothetical protein
LDSADRLVVNCFDDRHAGQRVRLDSLSSFKTPDAYQLASGFTRVFNLPKPKYLPTDASALLHHNLPCFITKTQSESMSTLQLLRNTTFLATLLIVSCKNNSTPPPPPAPQPETVVSPKPEVYLYHVVVDKLNLREQPNKDGKVVTQFPEGDFVEGTGEMSSNKEEITLRGIPYMEPYLKVTSTTPEQHQGWAYGAGLKAIYAGPRSTTPDLGKLSQLSAHLKALKVNVLDSGKKATDYVRTNFATSSGTLADAAFMMLESFLFRMEIEGNFYNMTETIQWGDNDYEAVWKETFDMNKYPATKALAANGFRLEEGEGMIFPVVDWAKLRDLFADKVTPPMKEYILQQVVEQKDKAYDDGGIVIGMDTIAERAIFWEKFNKQNPYFVRSYQTVESERWTRHTVLLGADNTPAFEYETQTLRPEFRKVWDDVMQRYPGTQLAKEIKTFSDLIASEGGKRTKKVEDWLTDYTQKLMQ